MNLIPEAPAGRHDPSLPQIRLYESERGLSLARRDRSDMFLSLWFFEWNMFGAVMPGEHAAGIWDNHVAVSPSGIRATIECEAGLRLTVDAVDDGAEVTLEATNRSGYNWPSLASIVPASTQVFPSRRGRIPSSSTGRRISLPPRACLPCTWSHRARSTRARRCARRSRTPPKAAPSHGQTSEPSDR
jgi:hypothetical protein